MLKKKTEELLNQQVTNEFYAAFLYLSMANQAEDMNLPGFASWLRVQFHEEQEHAEKLSKFLIECNSRVKLANIKVDKLEWKKPLDMAKDILKHEQKVTENFNTIMATAQEEQDFAALTFAQWFINEQVEEEMNSRDLITMFERAGDSESALLFVDHNLGKRKMD